MALLAALLALAALFVSVSVSVAVSVSVSASSASPPSASPPSQVVLLVAVDSLGWADVGFHGSPVPTPAIDALADESVRLTTYYVHPSSTATRAAVLTGKYAHAVGLNDDLNLYCPYGLASAHATVADVLARVGFHTAMVGKWHLGRAKPAHTPLSHGFHEFVGTYADGAGLVSKKIAGGVDLWRNGSAWISDTHATTLVADEARRILAEHSAGRPGQPLFLHLSFQAPGGPMGAASPGADTEAAAAAEACTKSGIPAGTPRFDYCVQLVRVDAALGSVVDKLRELGWWANATVALTTASPANPWRGSYTYPFRGGHGSLWEGGVRGVALLRSPARYGTAGADYAGVVHAVDWLPTLASLADASPALAALVAASGAHLDGMDMAAALARPTAPSPRAQAVLALDDAFEHTNRSAIRLGKWKLVVGRGGDPRAYTEEGPSADWRGFRSVVDWIAEAAIAVFEAVLGRERAWPYVLAAIEIRYYFNMNWRDPPSSGVFLYNLETDPYERTDLAEFQRDVVRRCLSALNDERARRPRDRLDVHAQHVHGRQPRAGLVASQPHVGFWAPYLDNAVSDAELAASADVSTPPLPINRLRRQLKMSMNLGFIVVLALTYHFRRRTPARPQAAPAAAAAAPVPAAARAAGHRKRD